MENYNEILKELKSLKPQVFNGKDWPYEVNEISENSIELIDQASDRKVWFIFDDNKEYIGVNWMQGIDYVPQKEDTTQVDIQTSVPVNGSAKTIINGALESINRRFNDIGDEGLKNKDKKYIVKWEAELYDNTEPFIGTEDEILIKLFGTRNVVDMSEEDMKWVMNLDKEIEASGKADYIGLLGVKELSISYYIDEVQNFINEYSDYLIGKEITYGKGNKYKISNVVKLFDNNKVIGFEFEGGDVTTINLEDQTIFIDGNEVESSMGDLSLILQEENKEIPEEVKNLIGRKVDLWRWKRRFSTEITNIEIETVKFEGEETNDFKISLNGEESYFIHPDAINEFLIGNEVEALLKSNDKGGTIQLMPEIQEEWKNLIGKSVIITTQGFNGKEKTETLTIDNIPGENLISFKDDSGSITEFARKVDFINFLAGEKAWIHPDEVSIQLIKEEIIHTPELISSPNHPEFIYYIIDKDSNKIKEGFQYKEDGRKNILRLRDVGINAVLVPKRELIPGFKIDPELESSWDTNITDQAVINAAFDEYQEIKEPEDNEMPDSTEVLFWSLKRKIDKLESALSLRKMKSSEELLNSINKIFTQLKKQR